MAEFAPHDLTADNSHSPFVVSGDPTAYGRYRAFSADAVGSSPWVAPLGATTIQLDIGTTQPLFTYAVRADSNLDKAPKAWTVRGSTDNFITSDVLLDTVIDQTGWSQGEVRPFGCDVSGSSYRYFKWIFTTNNGNIAHIEFRQIFLYNSASDIFINQLSLKYVFSFDPDTNVSLSSHGQANIFIGDSGHSPGSVTEAGLGYVYSSDSQIAKHTATFTLPIDGSGVIVPAVFDNPDSVDVSDAIVWASILGSVFTLGAVNSLKIYAVYFQVELSNGVKKYSFPAVQSVDYYSGAAAGDVTNPANSIDSSLTTYADMFRTNFSGLAIASQLRITTFGAFVEASLSCNNPPSGATGTAYSHSFSVTNALGPFVWSLAGGSFPPGLVQSISTGALNGIPTTEGSYSFLIYATNDNFSLSVNCSISITESFPVTSPSCMFEFYGLERPESVEVLPVPKKFDQVLGRFDKIGKVFGFRVRLIQNGSVVLMPFSVFGDDSKTADPINASPLYTGSFVVRPGRDNVYEIQFPKSVNTDILRLTLGPVADSFHRYDVLLKVQTSGMEGESRWMPIR